MEQKNYPTDFSIIICAYNPDNRLLKRCIEAIKKLDVRNFKVEIILIDNNSTRPLKNDPYIRNCLNEIEDFYLLEQPKQGVMFARIAGIEKSRGQYIIYFDCDNEPKPNYIQNLKSLLLSYPMVAAWGPGIINVDFIDGIAPHLEQYARSAFQERHEDKTAYANIDEWQDYYPYGTGLCTKTEILKEYVVLAELGQFTLTGRNGETMNSGEDTQMILLCIKMGYHVGISPSLQLTHIIPQKRANHDYLLKLAFGTSYCYKLCIAQVFPYKKEKIITEQLKPIKLLKGIFRRWRKLKKNSIQFYELAQYIGLNAGIYPVIGQEIPWIIKKIIKKLKLK